MHLQKPTFRPVSYTEHVVPQIISDLGIEALIVPFTAYKNVCTNKFLIAFVIIIIYRHACGCLMLGWQCTVHAFIDVKEDNGQVNLLCMVH